MLPRHLPSRVSFITSLRTAIRIELRSSFAADRYLMRALENGEFRPAPSSATLPGCVEKLISVPMPELDGGETPTYICGAGPHCPSKIARQRIVAAGIKEENIGRGFPFHCLVHDTERYHLEIEC